MIILKTCFHIKLNLGNYQSAEFGVDDFDGNLTEATAFVFNHLAETDIVLDKHAMKVLKR